MGFFDRILLGLYSLCVLVLSLIIGTVVVGWTTPLDLFQNALLKQDLRVGIGVLTLVFVVLSLKFLINVFGSRSEIPHAIIKDSANGQVRITIDALENLVKKTVMQIRGIREVKPRIMPRPEGTAVFVHVVVAPDLVIPEVSEEIQTKVKENLEQVAGVSIQSVKVLVENIAADAGKDRVYSRS